MSKNTNIADLINYISVDGSGNVVLTTGGQVATQSYVTTAVSNLVNSAPSTLDTLNELATALGNDANFATTVTNSIATKLPLSGGTLTGALNGTSATFSSIVSGTSIRSSSVGTFGFNTANSGEFQIYASTADGMIIAGRGSTHDFIITNKNGADVFRIPTGTINANFLGNIGIGTIPDNTYQGLTIYGTNPSLRLKASASGSWTWIEHVNSLGVNTFSTGVSHSTPVYVIKAGAGLDNPHFALTTAGNIGFGTVTPASKLDINGGNIRLGEYLNSASSLIGKQRSATGTFYSSVEFYSTTGEDVIIFNTHLSGVSAGERARITGGGSLGLGTSFPVRKMDIVSTSEQLRLAYDSGGATYTDFRNDSAGGLLINTSGNYIIQYLGGSEKIRLNTIGLGIGTTSPGALLDLGGSGGRKLLVYNGGAGNQSGFGVDLDGASYGAGAFFAYGGSDIGRYVIGSFDGTTFRSKLTVHGSGAVAIAAGIPTYPKLNVGGSLQTKRTIHSWYEATPPDGTSYWHIKTNMWGGGSPYGNSEYTMSLFKGYFYTYSALVREGMVGFHNWSGAIYNTASNGNLFANVYVSSDGYVVLVVNVGGGSYNSLTIDWYQAYEYPFRDRTVIAAGASGSTSGLF